MWDSQPLPSLLLIGAALPCVVIQRRQYRQAGVPCTRLSEAGLAAYAVAFALSVLYRGAPLATQVNIAAHARVSVDTLALAADCLTYATFAVTIRGLLQLAAAYRAYLHSEPVPVPPVAGAGELRPSWNGDLDKRHTIGVPLAPRATVTPLGAGLGADELTSASPSARAA